MTFSSTVCNDSSGAVLSRMVTINGPDAVFQATPATAVASVHWSGQPPNDLSYLVVAQNF